MATHTVHALLAEAGKFVVSQKGVWNHDDWERLLAQVEKMNLKLTDECKRNLGNILEAAKYFYLKLPLPAEAPAKKAPAKKKAKA